MVALVNGYIGEIPLVPNKISNAVHFALTGHQLREWRVFYYGDHDAELDELFGWSAHNVQSSAKMPDKTE
jgi:hypothetical protein